jgi:hypothetical protein
VACNYIFARPRWDNTREPFYIGESGDLGKELENHPKLDPARALGATEVHLHFLANSYWKRLDIETDLRRGHWTPLNYQPTPALPPVLGLGASGPFGLGTDLNQLLASMRPAKPEPVLAGAGLWPFGSDLDWLLRKR